MNLKKRILALVALACCGTQFAVAGGCSPDGLLDLVVYHPGEIIIVESGDVGDATGADGPTVADTTGG